MPGWANKNTFKKARMYLSNDVLAHNITGPEFNLQNCKDRYGQMDGYTDVCTYRRMNRQIYGDKIVLNIPLGFHKMDGQTNRQTDRCREIRWW